MNFFEKLWHTVDHGFSHEKPQDSFQLYLSFLIWDFDHKSDDIEAFDLSLKTLESGEISAMFAIPTLFLFNMQFSHLDKNFPVSRLIKQILNVWIFSGLISRMATQQELDAGSDWTHGVHQELNTKLEYEYRIMCSNHYYGKDCDTLCRPRNDQFGHFKLGFKIIFLQFYECYKMLFHWIWFYNSLFHLNFSPYQMHDIKFGITDNGPI